MKKPSICNMAVASTNNTIIETLDIVIRVAMILATVLVACNGQYLQSYCIIAVYIPVYILKYICLDKIYQTENKLYFKQIGAKPIKLNTNEHLNSIKDSVAIWNINGRTYISNIPPMLR